jgi:hypothetical protein
MQESGQEETHIHLAMCKFPPASSSKELFLKKRSAIAVIHLYLIKAMIAHPVGTLDVETAISQRLKSAKCTAQ